MRLRIGILNTLIFTTLLVTGSWSLAMTIPVTSAKSYLDMDFSQSRYLGGQQNTSQTTNYTVLSADLNLEADSPGFRYKLNPIAEGALEASEEFYFGVPEAYVEPRKIAPGIGLTIGRQKRTWSRLDEEFDLGVWQPQLRWDYLKPVQQGLIGMFFDWSVGSKTKLTFFASPLSIPDQGPQFQLQDGSFESANRWFVQPQGRVQLFQGTSYSSEAPLYFELDKPSEEELIMHSSFGLGIRHEWDGGPFWTQVNYAYKPRNQIHLGIECQNCAVIGGEAAPVEVTAVIHPTIVKHHVATLETGFDRIDDSGWVSLTVDVPQDSGFPDAYAEAPLDSNLIAGISYRHFVGSVFRKPSWLQYSVLKAWTFESERDSSLVSQDQVESSLDRYSFEEVVAIDWRMRVLEWRRNVIEMNHRYTYSAPERGGWLSSGVSWRQGPLSVSMGIDILGAEVDPASRDAGLFSRYRANDRVYGGLSYVF